jgi:hypothetical protein
MAENSVKLHIGVTREMQQRLETGGDAAVKKLAREIGLKSVESARLKRFGILTGEAEAASIKDIGRHEGIEFVEEDQKRRAL